MSKIGKGIKSLITPKVELSSPPAVVYKTRMSNLI